MTIWFLFRCCKDKTSHESDTKNATTTRLALLVFSANIIYGTGTFIVAWEESGSGKPKFYAHLLQSAGGSFMLTTLLLFYIHRLYTSFNNSIYALNKRTTTFLVVLAIISLILVAIGETVYDFGTSNNSVIYGWILFSGGLCIVLFEYISITNIFVQKLFKLTVQQRCSIKYFGQVGLSSPASDNNNNDNNNKSSLDINSIVLTDNDLKDSQLILIEAITKQSLLIISPCIGIILFIILGGFIAIFGTNSWLMFGLFAVNAYACIEICVAVFLSFTFSTKYYNFCCKRFHKCFRGCCVDLAVRKLNAK